MDFFAFSNRPEKILRVIKLCFRTSLDLCVPTVLPCFCGYLLDLWICPCIFALFLYTRGGVLAYPL